MERRRFLAALGSACGLAGCSGGRSTPTFTPAPLPDDPTPTPDDARFADTPCPRLDGPTVCGHTQPADADVRIQALRDVVETDGAFLAGLLNRGTEPVQFTPGQWSIWRQRGNAWVSVVGGEGSRTRTLDPDEFHEWLLLLENRVAYSDLNLTVVLSDLSSGRYALAVPTRDRTYTLLFEVVGTDVRTSGSGSAV